MDNKEIISSKEKIKEFKVTLGRTVAMRLEIFRDECELYVSQIEDLLSSKSEGHIKDFFSSQCYFLDSLKNISKQMLGSFRKGTKFEIVPESNSEGDVGLVFVPMESGVRIEGDFNWRKFNFLFNSILCDDEEKMEEMEENLRNGKTVILRYDKNKD